MLSSLQSTENKLASDKEIDWPNSSNDLSYSEDEQPALKKTEFVNQFPIVDDFFDNAKTKPKTRY